MEQGKIIEGEKYYKMAMDRGSREAEVEYNKYYIDIGRTWFLNINL